jgi:hypothetical protein
LIHREIFFDRNSIKAGRAKQPAASRLQEGVASAGTLTPGRL